MARLIDTGVFIEWERDGRPPDRLPIPCGEPFALASISASELLAGVLGAQPGVRRSRREPYVGALLLEIAVLPFDLDAARVHARLVAAMKLAGRTVGGNDLLIAATALAHGYAVVTRNRRDFDRVPGLTVEDPDWP